MFYEAGARNCFDLSIGVNRELDRTDPELDIASVVKLMQKKIA